VNGKDIPLTENSDPFKLAADTVTGPLTADTVAARLFLLPSTTLPKLRFEGDTAIFPGTLPVPDSDTDSVGLDALELIVSLPAVVPLACGLNVTLKLALWPELKVTGGLIPLKL
jgi:hypothetical protein